MCRWLVDEHGAVSATDTAFMSTSRNSTTPIEYLGGGLSNVLWVLRPSPENDSGYHCGADISLLAQFKHEDECLFPPFTMLTVLKPDRGADAPAAAVPASPPPLLPRESSRGRARHERLRSAAELCERLSVNCSEAGKTWMRIEVLPTFV